MMRRSTKGLTVAAALGVLGVVAASFGVGLGQDPYTTISSPEGTELVTSADRALEIAASWDMLRSAGYSDGSGNLIPGGDELRAEVERRQRVRLIWYGVASVLLSLALVAALVPTLSARRP